MSEEELVKEFYHKGQSFKSRVLRIFLRLFRVKKFLEKGRIVKGMQRTTTPQPPKDYLSGIILSTQIVNNKTVYILSPEGKDPIKYVVFFHGGAYVINFTSYHWKFATDLVKQNGCTVIAPDYPLLPEATYKERIALAERLYLGLAEKYTAEKVVLMGDSSGGNLALSLAQKMMFDGKPKPGHIVLLSPWLDVGMSNPEMKEVAKRDPLLPFKADSDLGKLHAGDRDIQDYLVSPLYGPVKNVGEISLFTGTDDILNPDAHLFKTKAQREGGQLNFYEYEHMIHDFPIFPLPESTLVLKQIGEILRGGNKVFV